MHNMVEPRVMEEILSYLKSNYADVSPLVQRG